MSFFKNLDKKQVLSWALYDFANSSYALIIISFIFPIFYRDIIAGEKYGDFYWGLIISISILLGGLASPILGAIADEHKRKKSKFIFLVTSSSVGTALLYFTGSQTLLFASVLFVLTNLFYEMAQSLYDSFLPQISTKETVGKISGFAWGLGYLGGVAAILLFKPFYGNGFENNPHLFKLTFPLTALFFLAFSLPAFIFLKEQKEQTAHSVLSLTKNGFKRVVSTIQNFKNFKEVLLFLLGFYLFNDALVTLFTFIPIFAKTTLGMTIPQIGTLLLGVQVLAFPFTVFFGWLSDKIGSKPVLLFTLTGWIVITLTIYIAESKTVFYIAALFASVVMGSSQSAARSWLSKIIPKEKLAEFFGFNSFASKIAATTGPIVFGAISSFSGNQRNGVLAMLPFFIFSIFIFSRLKEN